MKGFITKVIIVVALVVFFGSGVLQTIEHIEDQIIAVTVDLLENSEFIYEVRTMVQDVARDVVSEMIRDGLGAQHVTVP